MGAETVADELIEMDPVEVLGTAGLASHLANSGQRKSGHVISDLDDIGFKIFEVRIESLDDGLVLKKIEALAHHAGSDQTKLSPIETAIGKVPQRGQQELFPQRAKISFHKFIQSGGRIRHFARF
jgi:hypothetical protein